MSDPIKDSNLDEIVALTGTEVTPDDIDAYAKFKDIQHRGTKANTVLVAWKDQEDFYRTARKQYATWIIVAMIIQGICINVAFFLIGYGHITIDRWVASSFILGVFSEIAGLTLIVFKYFFPSSPHNIATLVEKL